MKGIFGLVGLLVALAIVGVVVKKQLAATQQSQQIQQQYKQAIEGAMQQPRPMPEDK